MLRHITQKHTFVQKRHTDSALPPNSKCHTQDLVNPSTYIKLDQNTDML